MEACMAMALVLCAAFFRGFSAHTVLHVPPSLPPPRADTLTAVSHHSVLRVTLSGNTANGRRITLDFRFDSPGMSIFPQITVKQPTTRRDVQDASSSAIGAERSMLTHFAQPLIDYVGADAFFAWMDASPDGLRTVFEYMEFFEIDRAEFDTLLKENALEPLYNLEKMAEAEAALRNH